MVRTQIQLTEEQAKEVKRITKTHYFRRRGNEKSSDHDSIGCQVASKRCGRTRRRRALNAVGKFSSLKRDISRKHDKYLFGGFPEVTVFVDTSALYALLDRYTPACPLTGHFSSIAYHLSPATCHFFSLLLTQFALRATSRQARNGFHHFPLDTRHSTLSFPVTLLEL